MFPDGVFVRLQDKEYQCVLVIEGRTVVVDAYVETDEFNASVFYITCQQHKVSTLRSDPGPQSGETADLPTLDAWI